MNLFMILIASKNFLDVFNNVVKLIWSCVVFIHCTITERFMDIQIFLCVVHLITTQTNKHVHRRVPCWGRARASNFTPNPPLTGCYVQGRGRRMFPFMSQCVSFCWSSQNACCMFPASSKFRTQWSTLFSLGKSWGCCLRPCLRGLGSRFLRWAGLYLVWHVVVWVRPLSFSYGRCRAFVRNIWVFFIKILHRRPANGNRRSREKVLSVSTWVYCKDIFFEKK